MDQHVKTENEMIAEFMGLVRHEADATYNLPQYYRPENDKRKKGSFVGYPEQLKYATSWDWLMPVVEKISQHVYESYPDHNGYKEVTVHERAYPRTFGMIDNEGKWMVRINRMHLEQEDTLIKATYKSVVEFINWFNSQPK